MGMHLRGRIRLARETRIRVCVPECVFVCVLWCRRPCVRCVYVCVSLCVSEFAYMIGVVSVFMHVCVSTWCVCVYVYVCV